MAHSQNQQIRRYSVCHFQNACRRRTKLHDYILDLVAQVWRNHAVGNSCRRRSGTGSCFSFSIAAFIFPPV
jgi:hypothetical protein